MYAICEKCKNIFKLKKGKKKGKQCNKCYSTRLEYLTDREYHHKGVLKMFVPKPTKPTKSIGKKKSKKRSFDIEQIKKDFRRWYSTLNQMEKYKIRTDITQTMRWLSRYKLLYEDQQEVARYLITKMAI